MKAFLNSSLLSVALYFIVLNAHAESYQHGFVKKEDGKHQVWNSAKEQWYSLESFWNDFSKSNDAKYWGEASQYPNYSDVKEFDTLLIQTKDGHCLMQFFHARWRRANDVQRWDDAFNDYKGCPSVFD